MVTTTGVPVHYVLAPAAHHDLTIAPEVIETYRKNILILGDKGYVGLEKRLHKPQDYQLIIQARDNMSVQNTAIEKRFLAVFRKTIESTNALLAGQFNIQFTRAKSAWGLSNRVIAKITALTFAIFLNFMAEMPLLQVKNFIF